MHHLGGILVIGGYACAEQGIYGKYLHLALNFAVNLKWLPWWLRW